MIELALKKLSPDAFIPQYATPGSACFDLCAIHDGDPVSLKPGCAHIFRTGLAFEIPIGWRMDVFSRSGHGFKNQVSLANSVGKIDHDYRGELMISLLNAGKEVFTVKHGDRIAQGEVNPVHRVTFHEVQELTDTQRGTGGLGSTGVSS